jgi:PAS domain S-box-containing protein
MRQRAETMSYEIIHNSPEGIVVLNNDLRILEINNKALELLGIGSTDFKGRLAADFFDPADFAYALNQGGSIFESEMFIPATDTYVKLTVSKIPEQHILFGIMKDVTGIVNYNQQLDAVRQNTIRTADEVITKQMRVAQEIASLLGETTAETKVALVNLKKILEEDKKEE